MIDEAALNHKPATLFSTLLPFVLVYMISQLLAGFIQTIPTMVYIFTTPAYKELMSSAMNGTLTEDKLSEVLTLMITDIPSWLIAVSLISFAAIIVCSVFYCVKIEKRPLSSMGFRKNGAVKEYLIGMGIGLVMLGLSFLIAFLTGSVTVAMGSFSPLIILFFVGFVIQGAGEETLVRGYLMVSIARDYRASVAVVVSSVAFSLLHLGNEGFGIIPFINIVLVGIFLGVYVFKRGSLWGACAIHSMWNFALGNIFGISVSGMSTMPSVFAVTSKPELSILNGGDFGLEGGICVTLVLLVSIALILLVKQKPDEITDAKVDYFA